MQKRRYGRRLLLFVAAVVLPSVALLVLSLYMVREERDAAAARAAEEQHRLVDDIRRELMARLDQVRAVEISRLRAMHPIDRADSISEVGPIEAFACWIEGENVVLPWEERDASDFETMLHGEGVLADHIRMGETEELTSQGYDGAISHYRRALEHARGPTQEGYVQLLLARAYARTGRSADAAEGLRSVLELDADVVDEYGIPLGLYAASRLAKPDGPLDAVLTQIDEHLRHVRLPAPSAAYLLAEVADRLVELAPDSLFRREAREVRSRSRDRVKAVEQALSIQANFNRLTLVDSSPDGYSAPEPIWISYGADPWLVSYMPASGEDRPALVAVRSLELFDEVESAVEASRETPYVARLAADAGTAGDELGASLPGVGVVFEERSAYQARRWSVQRTFYLTSLLLIGSVVLIGAYLLWRDVRRELHLSKLRSQFVSSVSHELKTPLTSIRMFAETLRLRTDPDPEMQSDYLDTIVRESERLSRLLNNVLDFSKIEQGTRRYQMVPTSLTETVAAAARSVQDLMAEQGFNLKVETSEDLPLIKADPDALQQAILNLVTNAVKYSGDRREIELRLSQRNGEAVIGVVDHGMGIAPAEHDRIFERYYRVATPESESIPGTGLGLTLVAHVAEAHGGRVTVDSTPGRGSVFSIHLPVSGA